MAIVWANRRVLCVPFSDGAEVVLCCDRLWDIFSGRWNRLYFNANVSDKNHIDSQRFDMSHLVDPFA